MLWVVGVAACSSVARADDVVEARSHAKHGIAAFGLHDYVTAANEYEAAFKLEPDPALLYNAAQAHRLGGNSARSLELYESCLRLFGAHVANAVEVRRHIAELRRALAAQDQAANAPPMAPTPMLGHAASEPPIPSEPPVTAPAVAPTVVMTDVPSPPPERPWWKKGWVWGTVAAVVVVGVAVGVGVGVGAKPSDPQPSMGALHF